MCFRHLAMDCPDTADRGSRSGCSVCYRLVQSRAANVPLVFTITEKAPKLPVSCLLTVFGHLFNSIVS